MVSEQSILELTRSIADSVREVIEMLGSMKSNLKSLKEELRKEEECEDYDEITEERSSDSLCNKDNTKSAKIPIDNKPDREGKGSQPNPDPETNLNPNSDPIPNLSPDPYSSTNPKLDPSLNPELDSNFESGFIIDEEAIDGDYSGDEGEDERKEKKEEKSREVSDERDENRSDHNLGQGPPLMPISPPPPLSRSSSLPMLWSKSMLFPSSLSLSENVTKKVETGSGILFRNERVQEPKIVSLSRPKPNPMILIWPKPNSIVLICPKLVPNVIVVLSSTNSPFVAVNGNVWLGDDHQELPPPPLPPPPLPPASLLQLWVETRWKPNSDGDSVITQLKPKDEKDASGDLSVRIVEGKKPYTVVGGVFLLVKVGSVDMVIFERLKHKMGIDTVWIRTSTMENRREMLKEIKQKGRISLETYVLTDQRDQEFWIFEKMAECGKLTSKKSQTKRDLEIFFSELLPWHISTSFHNGLHMEVDEKKSQELQEFSKFGEILKSRFGNLGMQGIQPEGMWLGNVHEEPPPPPLPPPLPPTKSTVVNVMRLHRNFHFYPP